MLYTTITIGDKNYNARLNAKSCVELEKVLGQNPLNVFTSISGNSLPSMNVLLTILHYSLKDYNHGLTMDAVYDLYDEYCDNGGNITSLIEVLLDVFKVSGFIPEGEEDQKN